MENIILDEALHLTALIIMLGSFGVLAILNLVKTIKKSERRSHTKDISYKNTAL